MEWSGDTQKILTWSKHTLQYRKWRNRLTWKTQTVWRPVLRLKLKIPCLLWERWKYRHVNIGIIPCVVVTSLETDAFVAIVAFVDADGNSNLSARSSRRNSRIISNLERKKKKVQGCASQNSDPTKSYSSECWRIGIERFRRDTPEILKMHLVQIWIRETKVQSGGIIQKSELHERNPCAPSSEEQPHYVLRSLVKAPETQKIVCLLCIRELQCTMLSKENEGQIQWILW